MTPKLEANAIAATTGATRLKDSAGNFMARLRDEKIS
jgi:hypothetical protein